MRRALIFALVASTLGWTPPAAAEAALCQTAAAVAATLTGVPVEILRAVLHVESSGWPWIANIGGESRRFETSATALAAIDDARASGKNVDVGCFQISTRHHGSAFRSSGEMLSPVRNAVYAGLYLADLRRRRGNWVDAIACYHSCTPALGDRYLVAVAKAFSAYR